MKPGGRPRLDNNGHFLRFNGLDSQTCNECHNIVTNAVTPAKFGVGGIVQSAYPGVQFADIADLDNNGIADINNPLLNTNGRFINPPFIFGSWRGWVELAGKEMTKELQLLKEEALSNPDTIIQLVTSKGTSYGFIVADADGDIDTSNIKGIDDDLVVKPFGRKGSFATIREFNVAAAQFHFGMQSIELVDLNVVLMVMGLSTS